MRGICTGWSRYGWEEDKPESWTDEAYATGGDPRSGLINMVHSDTHWYCRGEHKTTSIQYSIMHAGA